MDMAGQVTPREGRGPHRRAARALTGLRIAGIIEQAMALRVMPTEGAEVMIDHLGVTEPGVVHRVDREARSVEVATEDGRLETFTLNRATARFTAGGGLAGARLRFRAGG
jgi:hypothetical protein